MSVSKKLLIVLFGVAFFLKNPCLALPSGREVKQVQSYAQASQDSFVYVLLYELQKKQDDGYYLEIGAGHPSEGNNTYLLEKTFGWKGVSLDIADTRNTWFTARKNPLHIEDATKADYRDLLKTFPRVIDYLSLDIDDSYDTVLRRIPFDSYVFKVLTIEHDAYRFGNELKEKERSILTSFGYHLLCPDVSLYYHDMDCVFEDWWIHPSAFSPEVFSMLLSLDLKAKSHDQIIKILQNCKN